MSKRIKAALVTGLVCIGVGAGLTIAAAAMGGTLSMASVEWGPDRWMRNWAVDKVQLSNKDMKELGDPLKLNAADIKKLDFSLSGNELVVKSTDTSEITVTVSKNGAKYLTIDADGDTLDIIDERDITNYSRLKAVQIVLEVPKDHCFSDVELEIGAGSVNIDRLETMSMDLEGGIGSMEVQQLIVHEKLDAQMGVGNLLIRQAQLGASDIRCGIGSVELKSCELTDDADITGGVGEVRIALAAEKEDYNYELRGGIGELILFGTNYGSLDTDTDIDNGAQYTISLKSGIGKIELDQADRI